MSCFGRLHARLQDLNKESQFSRVGQDTGMANDPCGFPATLWPRRRRFWVQLLIKLTRTQRAAWNPPLNVSGQKDFHGELDSEAFAD